MMESDEGKQRGGSKAYNAPSSSKLWRWMVVFLVGFVLYIITGLELCWGKLAKYPLQCETEGCTDQITALLKWPVLLLPPGSDPHAVLEATLRSKGILR